MQTLGYILRRLIYGVILMFFVVVLNFILIRLAPGDPAEVIAGDMGGITKELLAEIRAQYGLDQPMTTQLWIYLHQIATGNLGVSYYFDQPVSKLIGSRVGATILLVLAAQVLSILLGVVMGVFSARKPNGPVSAIVSVISAVGYALPVFWTGIMLIILFASWIPVFPVEGMVSARHAATGWLSYGWDVARHLFLPAFTLAIIFLAQYARLSRASMIDVLGADYVRTARAKGVPEMRVIFKHALRNAILPILTVAGLQFGNLISGALLVETVFNWPGMGTLAFDSILRRDYPTVLGILIIGSAMVVVANIVTDLGYRLADPRIRTTGGRR